MLRTATMTIRTDTLAHAIDDLSDIRVSGKSLPARVDLDGGEETLFPRETEPGQWEAQSDSGRCYPL